MRLHLKKIEFSPDREGFSVGAELFASVQEIYFPAENWYDMAYSDLKEWIPSLISFGMNHTDTCMLPFMDGPYAIHFNRMDDDRIVASFLCDRKPVISCVEIDFVQFFQSVIGCCRTYDRFLFENGIGNHFVQEIKQLKAIIDS